MKKPLIIVLIVLILDQLTKYLFTEKHFTLIPKILDINYTTNTGSFFGILKGYNLFLIIVSVFIIIMCLKWVYQKTFHYLPLSFIIGGALGNLIDRLVFGFVRDFIDFKVWPVFNIADSFITIAILLLILKEIKSSRKGFK
ncbi:signal peptidase II [Candidatus Woesearchaeota archaeon]|nr:signal peptidase II [Candidatus Woesearchaeota archaeon]